MNPDTNTDHFYSDLKALDNFLDITQIKNFVEIPDNWYIVLTDVKGSTKAIEAGRYKDVNLVAASSVAALINLSDEFAIPFIYGGDGATCLIPESLLEQAKIALFHTQQISKKEFGLDIRVAFIPVKDLIEDGFILKIAKLKISEHYNQAILEGDGIDRAEFLLKDEAITKYDLVVENGIDSMADYTGLECRWQDIPSPKTETLALIVKVLETPNLSENACFIKVLEIIEDCYGKDADYQPLDTQSLHLTLEVSRLNLENKIQTYGQNWVSRIKNLAWIWLVGLYGNYQELFLKQSMMSTKKNMVSITSDYKKYDGSLKMIISGTEKQRLKMTQMLEQMRQNKELVYGIHVTNRALITCLVSPKIHQEVHFIDAADGGYALAAKGLKAQLKEV